MLRQTQRLNYPLRWDFRAKFSLQQRPNDSLRRQLGAEERDVLHETHAHDQDLVLARRGYEMVQGGGVLRCAGAEGEGLLQRKWRTRRNYRGPRRRVVLILPQN